MKNFAFLAVSSIVIFVGCMQQDTIPTKPSPIDSIKKTSDRSVLKGSALLYTFDKKYENSDNSGILVTVLGTGASTTTDSMGKWQLNYLDSGKYAIQFTAPGFDTMTAYRVVVKGEDTLQMGPIYSDTLLSIPTSLIPRLAELPPTVQVVSALATVKEIIRVDSVDDHGVKTESKRDTLYDFTANITTSIESYFTNRREEVPVGYMACINEQSTLSANKIPNTVLFSRSWQYDSNGFFCLEDKYPSYPDNGDKTKRYFKIGLSLKEYAKARNLSLRQGVALYLHFTPIWRGLRRVRGDAAKGPAESIIIDWIIGAPQSYQIQWR